MDVEKQVAYWREGSLRAFRSVPTLAEGEFWDEALFWTHLAVEHALKGHVAKVTRQAPPLIHNLKRLAEIARLHLSDEQLATCDALTDRQLRTRYLDVVRKEVDPEIARELIRQGKELRECLVSML